MEEMVEPDRTIMIVSIVGLVIIWGSVAYHKFVQGGGGGRVESEPAQTVVADAADSGDSGGQPGAVGEQVGGKRKKGGKGGGKKRRRKG
jgi:hypothetical protein